MNATATRVNLDVSKFYHQLFCLKRDFHYSNLPEPHAIRVINKPNSEEKSRVCEVQLFNPNGNMFVLEMWNEDAIRGVKYLWGLLEDEDEILLRIQDLDPAETPVDRRLAMFKYTEPTDFQSKYKAYPVTKRIVAKSLCKGQICELSRQCRRIKIDSSIQLLNGKLAMRDFAQWYQTVEAQQEDEDPDELQQMILHTLGKRTMIETAAPPTKKATKEKAEGQKGSSTTKNAANQLHQVSQDNEVDK